LPFLGIELVDRQQLNRRDAQLFQVVDPLDHAQELAPMLGRDTAAGVLGEALDMHLVDDQVVLVMNLDRDFTGPVEGRLVLMQDAQRSLTVVGPRRMAAFRSKVSGKKTLDA
jgi:hypothetical protein